MTFIDIDNNSCKNNGKSCDNHVEEVIDSWKLNTNINLEKKCFKMPTPNIAIIYA